MLTGTLVTAAGFLPVGFAKSTAGEYAGNIFWIVGLALIVSWIVAVVFTPYLGTKILVQRTGSHHKSHAYDGRSYRALRSAVNWSLKRRWLRDHRHCSVFLLLQSQVWRLWSNSSFRRPRARAFIEVRMPEGTSIKSTAKAAAEAEKLLAGDADAVMYTTSSGQGSAEFFLALNPVLPNPSFALTVILTKDAVARERLKEKLEKAIADGAVPQARIRIDRLNFGPPVRLPRTVSRRRRRPANGARDCAQGPRDYAHGSARCRSAARMERAGEEHHVRSRSRIAHALSALTRRRYRERCKRCSPDGRSQNIARELEFLDVIVRAVPGERLDPGHIGDLTILARNGQAIPLRQVATIATASKSPFFGGATVTSI